MRRIFGFTTLLLASLFAQALMPTYGLAESPEAPGSVQNVQMIEASLIPGYSYFDEAAIPIPTLPRRGRHYRHAEFHDYERLANISGEICDSVIEKMNQLVPSSSEPSNKGYASTGFIPQLERFNKTRAQLNRLLQKFSLGLAPGIEDFSEVASLYSAIPSEGGVPPLEYAYATDAGACEFKIISTAVGGVMK